MRSFIKGTIDIIFGIMRYVPADQAKKDISLFYQSQKSAEIGRLERERQRLLKAIEHAVKYKRRVSDLRKELNRVISDLIYLESR